MAPVERHQQVGLLGLRRHAGRRPGALDVDDDERQLEHRCEPDGLRLEVHAGPARGGHPERPAERRAQSDPGRGDLVLRLDSANPERLAKTFALVIPGWLTYRFNELAPSRDWKPLTPPSQAMTEFDVAV